MHYYQFNIKDFALHTSHLTLEEEGVYRRLLDYYYDSEKPIPIETQPVIRRLRLGSYASEVSQILSEFFTLEDDGYHNVRADIEIAAYKKNASTARKNGKLGGRPPKNKGLETQPVILANPEETGLKANQEPLTKNQEPLTISKKQAKKTDVDYSVFDANESQCEEIKRIRKINNKGKAGATLTQRVANSIAEELRKAVADGFDVESCLTEWEDRGWRTFKAEWMPKSNPGGTEPQEFSDITLQNINTLKNWTPPNEQ